MASANSMLEEIMNDISEIEGVSLNQNITLIPTGVDLLDKIAGGGIPVGKLVAIAGAPGGGKSSLACQIIAGFQRFDLRAMGFYADSEQAMSNDRLVTLGCDPTRTLLMSEMITMEAIYKIVQKIIQFKIKKKMEDVPFAFVWDSESASPTEKQLVTEDPSKLPGHKAKLLTHLLPIIAIECNKYNITPILINQLRDKMEMNMYQVDVSKLQGMGDKTITGGNIMKFLPYQLILVRPKENIDANVFGFSGVVSELKFVKNKNYTPQIKIELVLNYMRGYSNFWTKHRLLQNNKVIKGTAWQTLENCKEKKFRKKEIEELYNSDEDFKKCFEELYCSIRDEVTMSPEAGELKQNSNIEIDDSDLIEEKTNIISLNQEIPVTSDSLLED
jgi:RecA/RadA recombinase